MKHTLRDYDFFGFRPAEVISFLRAHSIPIDLGTEIECVAAPSKPVPEWKRIMSLESAHNLQDWVFALIDVDPYDGGFMPDDMQADFQRYEDLLTRAIVRGELPATEGTTKRNQTTWQISAPAFHAWCEAKGLDYPLLPPKAEANRTPVATPAHAQTVPSRWPWGNHTTKALELLADAAKQWWSTYDPDEFSTAPTNKEVIEYVTGKGGSTKLADSIASILRADDLPTGRRKGGGE